MEERSQARGESALFILILAAILIVVNIVSIRLFHRVDLTHNRAHSLSRGSLRVIEDLKDRLEVKAYFTKNLPPPFNTTEQYVRDILEEYQARSKGKMIIEFIDPSTDEKAEEARQAGIREVTHQLIEKDQASEKKGFRGMQFLYMGDSKIIDVITDTVGLEYEITSKLKQLSGEKSTIAFLQGHKEPKTMRPPPQDPYATQQQEPPAPLENTRKMLTQYNVRELDLRGGEDEIPDDIKAMVVIGPTEEITEDELFRIDRFVMKGGSAAFFVDGIAVDTSTGLVSTSENDIGLGNFLAHFGIKIRYDIVFDLQCDTVPIRGPFGLPLRKKYPGWPVMEITSNHPSTFKLPVLTFPWGSSLSLRDNPPAGKVKTTVLAKSSDKSWREEGSIELEPSQADWKARHQEAKKRGPFVMAAAVEGKFKSYFAGRDVPAKIKEKGETESIKKAEKEGRILVSGSSQMVLDPIVGVLARLHRAGDIASNQAFILNTIDWLTQDQDLIEIRAKGVENPRLETISDSTRNLVKYGNILAWPLLFIVIGVTRWSLRSKRGRKKRTVDAGDSTTEENTAKLDKEKREKEREKESGEIPDEKSDEEVEEKKKEEPESEPREKEEEDKENK